MGRQESAFYLLLGGRLFEGVKHMSKATRISVTGLDIKIKGINEAVPKRGKRF
jgi:hypothetical protein